MARRLCLGLMLLAALPQFRASAQTVGFEATLGGEGRTTAFATRHHEGFTYVAGTTTSADFPSTDGSTYRGDDGEVGDMFLAKFNAAGQLVAATLLGGSGSDFANGMAITTGNEGASPAIITLSGWTGSSDFRTLNPIQPAIGGKTDAVIAQFDLNLNLLFSTFLGGAEDDQFSGVAAMSAFERDLMFFGFTSSTDFPFPTPNAAFAANTVKNLANNADGLLVRLLPDRTIPMASLFRRTSSGNGTQNEVILAGAYRVIPDGPFQSRAALYVTGWTDGDFFRFETDPTGSGKRIFMSEIDPFTGGRGYSRVVGGSGDDIGQGIAITPEGVVVVGQTTSADLPNAQPLFQAGPGGGTDAVLLAWNHSIPNFRPPPYIAYLGGAGDDSARAIGEALVQGSGPSPGLHFAGVTASANLPLPSAQQPPPAQAGHGGGTDGFYGRLGVVANPESSGPPVLLQARGLTYHGGPGDEAFTALAVVSEDAEGFEAVALGARRPPPLAQAAPGNAGLGARQISLIKEVALLLNYVYGRAGLDADVAVSFKPRGALAHGAVEKVTLVVTNTLHFESVLVRLQVDDIPLLSGEPTTELTRVELLGAVQNVTDPLPFFEFNSLINGLIIAPGMSFEVDLYIRSLPGALLATPPGPGLHVRITSIPDLHPENDTAEMVFPLLLASPRINVRFLGAAQDPAGVLGGTARYQFRVENNGSAVADNVEVVFNGSNLRNATFRIDGGAAGPLPGIDSPGGSRIPVGALQPGEGRDLLVEGEPASPANGTGLAATGSDPADTNPENNAAGGETTPGPGPDYAVEIVGQATALELVDGVPAIRLATEARLTLAIPEGIALDRVPPASLVIRHAGTSPGVSATPGNLGSCERLDATTTGCSFPAAAFFQPGQPPGLIKLSITELLDIANPPTLAAVSLSVSGDGQNPEAPNNFASATREIGSKGALSFVLIFASAETVRLPGGQIVRFFTQHVRLRNEGPGAVDNIRLNIFLRYDPTIPNLPPMVQLPRVISGSAAGVSINATPSGQEVLVASLAPRAEIVLEFVDMYETMGRGGIDLEVPPGADLNAGNNPQFHFDQVLGHDQIGRLADVAIWILSQHFEVEERAGGRVPVRVTEFAVANRGEDPCENVSLGLRGSGVHLGGSLLRRSGSGAGASLSPVLGVNRPEAPANPNVIQVSLGRFLPGQTNLYVLRDDVADPGRDALLGLSGDVTSGSFDANVANNVFSRDTEYRAAQATLDYSVFLRQTSLERFPDPNLSTPAPVPAIRSRFECGFSGAQEVGALPRFILEIQQPGTILDVRLVPKTAGTPIPITGFQITRDHALSFSVMCDFSASIARDFYIETVAAIFPPGQSAQLAIKADLTGDGEIPSDGNNNRARGSFEYQAADLAVTRLPGGAELPGLFDGGAVTDRWLVENKSPTATARGVRLARIETTTPPLPPGLERAVEVLAVTGDLPLDSELCLQGAAGGSCLVGDIEPGGRREVLVLTRLATLPGGVTWSPVQVTLGLHAVADNEALLADNTATYERLARLVVFGVARVEGGEFVIQLAIPSGGGAVVIEQAPAVAGPWTPVVPQPTGSELRLPVTGQQGYVRGRASPATP